MGHEQTPPVQDAPLGHALAQAPQFLLSLEVLMQVVLPGLQVIVPVGQPQLPDTQLWPDGQIVPHVPQLFESVLVSTSQPFVATLSQSA